MFCPNCGTEIKEGLFCPKCGTRIAEDDQPVGTQEGNATNSQTPPVDPNVDHGSGMTTATMNYGSKSNIGMIVGVVAAVLAIIVVLIIIVGNKKTTVNLDKYVRADFYGYDSLGKADSEIDWASFEKDYGGKIKIKKSALKKHLKKVLSEELERT